VVKKKHYVHSCSRSKTRTILDFQHTGIVGRILLRAQMFIICFLLPNYQPRNGLILLQGRPTTCFKNNYKSWIGL